MKKVMINSLIGNSIHDILNAALEIFKQQSHRSADGISAFRMVFAAKFYYSLLLLLNFESDS